MPRIKSRCPGLEVQRENRDVVIFKRTDHAEPDGVRNRKDDDSRSFRLKNRSQPRFLRDLIEVKRFQGRSASVECPKWRQVNASPAANERHRDKPTTSPRWRGCNPSAGRTMAMSASLSTVPAE